MSDRHHQPRVPAITASARILQPVSQDTPKKMTWHDDAWGFRDVVGELRFAEMWLGNAFSRSRLIAARRPAPGEEPQPVESGPAFDAVARLANGVGGQAALLRSFAPFLLVPGIGYLVGEPKARPDKFIVVDTEDIKAGRDSEGNPGFELREGDGSNAWRKLAPDTVVTKVFRPHPRRRWEPDSPTRAALPILRELVLLTQHVEATAESRLAGAGVQAFPDDMVLPPAPDHEVNERGEPWDPWEWFIRKWFDAMTKPIKDRSLVAAKVPFPIRMNRESIQAFKDGYISYWTEFDDKSIELREEAITRLGNAMDMPRPVLTGEERNHWGDWQVEEQGLKMHVEPGLETVADGLTIGYLEPALSAASDTSRGARRDLEAIERDNPGGEWIIWYDTSDLRVRPDRSTAAGEAYDRYELMGPDYLKEVGLTDAEPFDLHAPETEQRIWLGLLDGEMAPLALVKLGLATEEEIAAAKPAPPQLPAGAPGQEPEGLGEGPGGGGRGTRELPQTREREPQPSAPEPVPAAAATIDVDSVPVPDHPPSVTPEIAIVAALEPIVHRALERAGRRALNRLPRNGDGQLARDCPAERLHTCHPIDELLSLDALFEDAWERVPEVAERLHEDGDALVATLDAYVRLLVTTQSEHSWESLERALGMCGCSA